MNTTQQIRWDTERCTGIAEIGIKELRHLLQIADTSNRLQLALRIHEIKIGRTDEIKAEGDIIRASRAHDDAVDAARADGLFGVV